jgi:CheY-like chemotaxis protein
VSDEALILRACRRILEHAGYRVWTTTDVANAAEVVADAEAIDLLLCDALLAVIEGNKLAARLRRIYPQLSVVFLTDYLPGSEALASLDLGDAALLRKPFLADDLVDVIGEALAG